MVSPTGNAGRKGNKKMTKMRKLDNVIHVLKMRREARRILKETLKMRNQAVERMEMEKQMFAEKGWELHPYDIKNHERFLEHIDYNIMSAKRLLQPRRLVEALMN